MVELVDTSDLGSGDFVRAGSSPVTLKWVSNSVGKSVGLSYQKSWVQVPSSPIYSSLGGIGRHDRLKICCF